jgi:hypothetical protein
MKNYDSMSVTQLRNLLNVAQIVGQILEEAFLKKILQENPLLHLVGSPDEVSRRDACEGCVFGVFEKQRVKKLFKI